MSRLPENVQDSWHIGHAPQDTHGRSRVNPSSIFYIYIHTYIQISHVDLQRLRSLCSRSLRERERALSGAAFFYLNCLFLYIFVCFPYQAPGTHGCAPLKCHGAWLMRSPQNVVYSLIKCALYLYYIYILYTYLYTIYTI